MKHEVCTREQLSSGQKPILSRSGMRGGAFISMNLQHEVYNREQIIGCQPLAPLGKSVEMLDICEMCTRNDFEPTRSNTPGWSGPKDQQNRTDIFLSVYGVMHVIIRSRKDKGKELKEWIMRDIIPRGYINTFYISFSRYVTSDDCRSFAFVH